MAGEKQVAEEISEGRDEVEGFDSVEEESPRQGGKPDRGDKGAQADLDDEWDGDEEDEGGEDDDTDNDAGEEENSAGDDEETDSSDSEDGDSAAGFDAALLARAREAGFNPKDFETAAGLRGALGAYEARIARIGREQLAAQQRGGGRQPDPDHQRGRSGDNRQQQGKPKQSGDETIPQLSEELDPTLRARDSYHHQRISEAYERMQAMEERLQSMTEQLMGREVEAFGQRFDGYIAGLGKEWESIYGSGDLPDLDDKSEAYQNRMTVWAEMEAMRAGYRATGQKIPKERDLFNRVHASIHADKLQEINNRKVAKTLKKQAASAPLRNKGTRKPAKPASREERALTNLRRKLRSFDD